ncbi:hypothetical protein [Rhizobium leguminosarum]|uniref:hypothetical protein n=1 Tax=Rhizobium leguminosarum TaxID=384 RepID=UPI001030F1BD|nr:hypothetical protein [Rhizobium leguminosarum]TAV74719.1 hypothetical protein ELI28_14825 [Rhizobium leguminosarum]TAV79318.1 hypothetical protein ELI27_14815 [Rhizobium leguminosarum]
MTFNLPPTARENLFAETLFLYHEKELIDQFLQQMPGAFRTIAELVYTEALKPFDLLGLSTESVTRCSTEGRIDAPSQPNRFRLSLSDRQVDISARGHDILQRFASTKGMQDGKMLLFELRSGPKIESSRLSGEFRKASEKLSLNIPITPSSLRLDGAVAYALASMSDELRRAGRRSDEVDLQDLFTATAEWLRSRKLTKESIKLIFSHVERFVA